MEPVIWIEVVSSNGQVLSRARFEKKTVRIGRGYQNDIVLDDPFVAPSHLVVEMYEDGRISARELDTLNGIYVAGSKTSQKQIDLDGNKIIRLGQTLLRIRTSATPVVAERILKAENHIWRNSVLLVILLVLLETLSTWLASTEALKVSDILMNIFIIFPVMFLAGFWSFLSRVYSRTTQFGRHIQFACFLLFGLLALGYLDEMGSYALSTNFIHKYKSILIVILIAYYIYRSWRLVNNFGTMWKAIATGGLSFIILASIYTMPIIEPPITGDEHIFTSDFFTFIEPPMFRLVPPQSRSAFLAKIAQLENDLDKKRQEEPPEDYQPDESK